MKARMVSVFAALTSVALFGCGGGVDINVDSSFPQITPIRNTDFVAREPINFNLASAGRTRLVLSGISSSIVVNGAAAGSYVTITGERRVGSDSLADAQAQLPQLLVEVQELGADVLVRTSQPRDTGGRSFVVDYQISVPASFALSIASLNGSIDLRGMSGNVETSLLNGRSVATLQVPAAGSVSMTAINGDIDLHLPPSTSATLSAQVGIGTILLQDLQVHNEVRSNTTLQGTLGAGGATVTLKTINGSIRIDGVT